MAIPFGPIGAAIGTALNFFGAKDDRAAQMKAAKNQVQWRVEDAEKAGVNPLAALGMNPISIAPTSVGDPGFAEMGASLDRAVDAGSTQTQQMNNMQYRLLDAQVTGAELDNEIRRAEIASKLRRTISAPGAASMGVPAVEPNTARGADYGGQRMVLPGGITWDTLPVATSEEVERQSGDMLQEPYGFWKTIAEAFYNGDMAAINYMPGWMLPPRLRGETPESYARKTREWYEYRGRR